jgi:hypothetical protein
MKVNDCIACDSVKFDRSVPMLHKHLPTSSHLEESDLKLQAEGFSEVWYVWNYTTIQSKVVQAVVHVKRACVRVRACARARVGGGGAPCIHLEQMLG